jgi:hypothetical protein
MDQGEREKRALLEQRVAVAGHARADASFGLRERASSAGGPYRRFRSPTRVLRGDVETAGPDPTYS